MLGKIFISDFVFINKKVAKNAKCEGDIMMNDITKPSDNAMVMQKKYKMNSLFSKMYTNDVFEIGLVLSGTGTLKVLDSEIPCKSGDVFVIRPDCPYCLCPSDPDEVLTVKHLCFDADDWLEGETLRKEGKNYCYGVFADNSYMAYAVLTTSAQNEISSFMDVIQSELKEKKSHWEGVVRAYLSMILITIERYIGKAIKSFPAVFSKQWTVIASVIRIVNERFSDNELTLAEIANELYISQSHLSKMFKKYIGESFGDYLRKIRVDHACKLLKNTEYTVKEIAVMCGKKDLQSFYNTFYELKGVTPTQYRTKNDDKLKGAQIMSIFVEISENLQKGKAKIVKELVQQAIDEGSNPEDILTKALIPGMAVIGEKFKNNEVFVPEVLVAARAMNMGAQILKPYLAESGVKAVGKACIGTVRGDLHDIGKNLVKMMLEGRGLEVIDLGIDVLPETFVNTAKEENCQIICCSALLTTTMGVMADVVTLAEAEGIRDKVKIMIGGAPVTEDFCKEIGADCYTQDASSAAEAAVKYCEKLNK